MLEKKKRLTNGFGGSFADIRVVVEKPFDKQFIDEGWDVLSCSDSDTTFRYICRNQYQGDDETVVYTLFGDFPSGFDSQHMKIDWSESVY